MAQVAVSLFDWDAVEARSDLERFFLVRDHLPDRALIQALEAKRGQGRDDYPVAAMWNAVVAGVVFQHPSIESLKRELSRNPALLQACGFEVLPLQKKPVAEVVADALTGRAKVIWPVPEPPRYAVPSSWNFSRFLRNLIAVETKNSLVSGMIPELRRQLMVVLPDFGQHLGYDGKAIESYSTGRIDGESGQRSDPDADWGKHETSGVDARTGKLWKKVKSWFGYGLHLIADTRYEIPVTFHLTPASHSEQVELRVMLGELFEEHPELAERCADFSADRGLDCAETKAKLWDEYRIRPLIDTRELWREEKQAPDYDPSQPITRPLYPERADTVVYTEKGGVHCVCPITGTQRGLAFQGFEADRDTLKYRCPAAAYGLQCQGQAHCHAAGQVNPGEYGRIVRIDITEQNRRIFVPTPYGSPSWKRGYARRSALERINNRVDHGYGFEQHFIRGQAKMKTRIGLALAIMMAMALGHVKAGRIEQMRSLVQPIQKAA
ncbi:MAG TPA: transposase [Methylococcaceae bacterium]|nr:transposase [Methylococcaceae bacterium]